MNTSVQDWFSTLKTDQAEIAKVDFATMIDRAIREKKWSRKEFAQTINASPAWVTKVLRGDVNLTIETMAKLCQAVGYDFKISMTRAVEKTDTVGSFASVIYAAKKFNRAYEMNVVGPTAWLCNDSEYLNAA